MTDVWLVVSDSAVPGDFSEMVVAICSSQERADEIRQAQIMSGSGLRLEKHTLDEEIL